MQQMLLPLFPKILLREINDDLKNENIIDAVRLWSRFDEFREDMTSSCFLVKLVKNDAWEIHTEPLYMLPEGIPPSLKGWLEREFRPHVALKDKGLYSPLRHMKQWDEDSFSQICLHFPATPEELAESDIFWIQNFIRDIKKEIVTSNICGNGCFARCKIASLTARMKKFVLLCTSLLKKCSRMQYAICP